jgi:hypothetical protein
VVAGRWTVYVAYELGPLVFKGVWISVNLTQHDEMAQPYPGLAVFIYVAKLVLCFIVMDLLFYGSLSAAPAHMFLYGEAYLGMCYLSGWLISADHATCSAACRCSCYWYGLVADVAGPYSNRFLNVVLLQCPLLHAGVFIISRHRRYRRFV